MKKLYRLLLNKKYKLKSYIDSFSNKNISGWVYEEGIKFSEIRLLIGNNVVANSKIEIFREDVNRSLKINDNLLLGFSLDFNFKDEFKKYKGEPRLIVFNNDSSSSHDLFKNKKYNSIKNKLKNFFQGNINGLPKSFDLILEEDPKFLNSDLGIESEKNEFLSSKNLSIKEYEEAWRDLENKKNFINEVNIRLDYIESKKSKKRFVFF
tara:strand:- start:104 stop:727 length:624 start_codon:yes stop_codon:yes gene_type:complete